MKRLATISEQEIKEKHRLLTPRNTTKCDAAVAYILQPDLSKKIAISRIHTDRPISATHSKFSPREVQSLTGLRSLLSLAVYQRTSSTQKLEAAQVLHSKVGGSRPNM